MACDKRMKQRYKCMYLSVALLCLTAILLSGCSKGAMADGKGRKGYSFPEIMVIAMAEKNRYEEVCTEQIWAVPVGGGGMDFATYLTDQIKSFMEEMKIMTILADENNVSLSAEERATMSSAAVEYYDALSREDISYMDVSKEDVQTVFEDYCLANKLVSEMTKDINLEVSDSEAKVILLMQAQTDNKETADALWQAASQENADFGKCAESAGAAVTTRQLGRAESSKAFEDAAFALTTGQISGVIADGDSYYVLKCVNDYDEEATKARKTIIFEERKRKAFEEIYAGFKSGITLTYTDDPWEKLNLSEVDCAKNADFFEIYEKHMKQ